MLKKYDTCHQKSKKKQRTDDFLKKNTMILFIKSVKRNKEQRISFQKKVSVQLKF